MGIDCTRYISGWIYDRRDFVNRAIESDHKESSRKGKDTRLCCILSTISICMLGVSIKIGNSCL